MINVLSGGAVQTFLQPLAEGFAADLTAQAFKQTLLAARSVIYMDPNIRTSGKHVAQVAEFVARGEVELAIHQIAELQKYTTYVAAPVARSAKREIALEFIKHLTGPQARERLAQAGYTSPE